MERETGIEPATSSLGSWHSTTELLPPSVDPLILASMALVKQFWSDLLKQHSAPRKIAGIAEIAKESKLNSKG